SGKVTALKAKLGTFAPGSDLLALFFVDRIAAAAALADNHFTSLAGALQRLVDGLRGLRGELRRVLVLGLAVERDVHAVVGHFAGGFGAQGYLVVALIVGDCREAGQAGN